MQRLFGRARRRRSIHIVPLSLIFVLIALVVIRSQLGLAAAGVLLIGALTYGRYAVLRQINFDRNWHALERLRMLSGVEFEQHVAELYRRLGYRVQLTRGSGDQGIDVLAQSPNQRIGIQCKQWTDTVGNSGVQEAIAGRAFYNCSHSAVVCTSSFTKAAKELAARTDVQLIDGLSYISMVNQFQPVVHRRGMSAWIPKGRGVIIQAGLLASALFIVIVHFKLQTFELGFPQRYPQAYESRTGATAPYQAKGVASPISLADTVALFYSDLNSHEYTAAYSLLSQNFRASIPYSTWVNGYADTLMASPRISVTTDPGSVSVIITARELNARHDGTQQTIYSGAYRGVRGADGSWLIDSGYLHMVSRIHQ